MELILRRQKDEDLFKLTMWWPEGGAPPEEQIRATYQKLISDGNLTIRSSCVEITSPQENQLIIIEANLRHLVKGTLQAKQFRFDINNFPISTFELGEFRLPLHVSYGSPA